MMDNSTITHGIDQLTAVRSEITKTVVGQADVIDQALICLVAAGHALVADQIAGYLRNSGQVP